jgi:hypothetical protein
VRRYAPPAAAAEEERRCFPAAVLGVALKPCLSGFALILGPTPFLTPLLAI